MFVPEYPKCPMCDFMMGTIIGADDAPSNIINWCKSCDLDHFVDQKLWKWNGIMYSEEDFKKVLKLKAFW
jgi:hypothetical protein